MDTVVDVAVVGTLNVDVIVRVDRLPAPGETVLGQSMSERLGGKGSNQARAAAPLATTALVGAVGDDEPGVRMRAAAHDEGVDVTHVLQAHGKRSGQAIIEVDDDGENRIVVLSGANAALTTTHVEGSLDALDPTIVLTQLESPMAVTEAVAAWCVRNERRLLLNPSPAAALDDAVVRAADPLVVNESEAAFYAGLDIDDSDAAARRLLAIARSAVITLGADGVVVAQGDSIERIAVDRVRAVDTTGAGDVFAGTLAAHLADGVDLVIAARRSAAAATALVAQPRGG
ncbi:ribokinase [Gordonia sp. OPL2]|uniref:ribokinase n=1 Tax=Gordonia sp. OPL2 TaxID=2486274 RepID=UPI0016553986|nr:ribokinase [Gordonia sp. OPL2]ROZ88620.1 ribokinase [Gordonia sp. OPL2]